MTTPDPKPVTSPELEWKQKWYELFLAEQKKQTEHLRSIKSTLTFLGLIVLIGGLLSLIF